MLHTASAPPVWRGKLPPRLLGQRLEHELIIERVKWHLQPGAVWCNARLMTYVIANTGAAHAKHSVCIQIRIAFYKYMGDETVVALSMDHTVQMGRTVWVLA